MKGSRIGQFLLTIMIQSILIQFVMGQPVNNYIGDAVQPAPNTASLGKYGDIPVSHYTGVPNISVPIHQLHQGPISLNISLAYHAGGIRVDEMASRVGLGWSLIGGGIISRVVSGLPDETINGYYNKGNELTNLTSSKVEELIAGTRDGEPDLFSFNCGGFNGQFYFNENKDPVLVPRQDIRIEWTFQNNQFEQFVLTTPDGMRYYFGSYNNNSAVDLTYASLSSDPYYSTWHLLRIESMDGLHFVIFDYEDDNYSYKSLSSCSWFASECMPGVGGGWANWNSGSWMQGSNCTSTTFYQFGNKTYYYNTTNIVGKRLSGISSFDEDVLFVSDTSRMDLSPSQLFVTTNKNRLDRIEIRTGSGQYTFCKKFEFAYDYFVTEDVDHANLPEGKRLKLIQLLESSCDDAESKNPYKFEYDTTHNLPWRLTKARDHWDFPNGKFINDLEFVNIPSTQLTLPDGSASVFGNADRGTDSLYEQAAILKNITFPTGGSSSLEYESHRVTVDVSNETEFLEVSSCDPPPSVSCCGDPLAYEEIHNFSATDTIGLGIRLSLVRLPQFCSTTNVGITMYVYDGAQLLHPFPVGFSIAEDQDPNNAGVTIELSPNFTTIFQPNINYRIRLQVTNGWGRATFYNTSITRKDQMIGGVRLKKMTTHDGMSTLNDIVSEYQYKKSNGESSGVLLHQPLYANALLASAGGSQQGSWFTQNVQSITYNTQSFIPRSSFESNHMGYERVIEIQEDNGQVIHAFSVNRDIEHLFSPAHPKPPRNINVFNGSKVEQQIKDISQQILSSISIQPSGQYPGTQSVGRMVRLSAPLSCGPNSIVFPEEFSVLTDQYRVAREISTLDGVSTTRDYEYDATNRFLMPVRETMLNSAPQSGNASLFETSYRYPHDFPGQPAEDDLVSRNILVPIEITKKVDGVIWDRSLTEYGQFTTTNGVFPYPRIFYRDEYTEGAASLNVRQAEILGYDSSTGKPSVLLVDGWDDPSFFFWNANGLIDSSRFIGYGQKYEYYPDTRLLSRIINIDGTAASYTYDQLCRLNGINDECRGVFTEIAYEYGDPQIGGNFIHSVVDYPRVQNSGLDTLQTIQYFDGLGRMIQNVDLYQGPTVEEDIVTATLYDNQGRIDKQYEPTAVVANHGAFTDLIIVEEWESTQNTYEASPLNRMHSVTPPGWFATIYDYGSNATALASYKPGELSRATTIDEDGNTTATLKDKRGRIVLTRLSDSTTSDVLDTETLYDPKDRPVKILPPGTTVADTNLIFAYEYYGNDLVSKKKIPDQDTLFYRYNDRDLLIHYQDGFLRSRNEWFANNYDEYGRLVTTGFTATASVNNASLDPLVLLEQQLTLSVYGTVQAEIDKLIQKKTRVLEADGTLGSFLVANMEYQDPCNRLSEMQQNNLLNADSTSETMNFTYDLADNILEENYSHLIDNEIVTVNTKSTIDFAGRSLALFHQLNGGSQQEIIKTQYTAKNQIQKQLIGKSSSGYLQTCDYSYLPNRYINKINNPDLPGSDLFSLTINYDQTTSGSGAQSKRDGNISELISKVQGGEMMISAFKYDFFDRLIESHSHTINNENQLINSGIFDTKYKYDDRGNFEELIRHGQYISNGSYKTATVDSLHYTTITGTNKVQSIIDEAEDSVKVYGIKDPGGGIFQYDANGNVIVYPGKNATITYNHLNLPAVVLFASGHTIEWTYDANGSLLRKVVMDNTDTLESRYYIGSTEYRGGALVQVNHGHGRVVRQATGCDQNQQINGILKDTSIYAGAGIYSKAYISSSGEILFSGSERVKLLPGFKTRPGAFFKAGIDPCPAEDWQYEYTLKDHLGNTRIVFADLDYNGTINPATEILDENHYYPFGMKMTGAWDSRQIQDNQYLYNGKELHEDFDLNWIHYGARFYDPGIGRFIGVDPISDKFPHVNTYNYAENSPIANIDLWGLQVFSIHGTNSSNKTFEENPETLPAILELSGNETIINQFNWPKGTNGLANNEDDRSKAAEALSEFVLENLEDGEDITLVGHSHGGNVAIQAIDQIQAGLDVKEDERQINLITIATPAYNDPDDRENPANTMVDSHTQFYSNYDMVQTILANTMGARLKSRKDTNTKRASRTYNNSFTNNINVSKAYGSSIFPVKSHSIHKKPNLLSKK